MYEFRVLKRLVVLFCFFLFQLNFRADSSKRIDNRHCLLFQTVSRDCYGRASARVLACAKSQAVVFFIALITAIMLLSVFTSTTSAVNLLLKILYS